MNLFVLSGHGSKSFAALLNEVIIEKYEVLFLPGFELGTSGSWGVRITTGLPLHHHTTVEF